MPARRALPRLVRNGQELLAIWSNYNMITVMASVPAKLVAIGNSRGVRLPKAMIEQAGLGADIELEVIDGAIVIRSHRPVRAGWAEAAKLMASRGEAPLPITVNPPTNAFDRDEWSWE